MNFKELLNPSTIHGALILGVCASLIAGIILGFFAGKTYEKRKQAKTVIKGNGNNTVVQNSNFGK